MSFCGFLSDLGMWFFSPSNGLALQWPSAKVIVCNDIGSPVDSKQLGVFGTVHWWLAGCDPKVHAAGSHARGHDEFPRHCYIRGDESDCVVAEVQKNKLMLPKSWCDASWEWGEKMVGLERWGCGVYLELSEQCVETSTGWVHLWSIVELFRWCPFLGDQTVTAAREI